MKNLILNLSLLGLLAACTANVEEFTGNRGIGVYPGNPEEDFSPQMVVDQEYRNIALNRAAYNSSSYDYSLTANLATDGIIEETFPKYLEVNMTDSKKLRREREWLLDRHLYTMVTLFGSETFIEINLRNNWKETFDKIKFMGLVSYIDENADGSHEIRFLGSNDWNNWTPIHTIKGKSFIGKEARARKHSDPDKADAMGDQLLPTRLFEIEARLPKAVEFSNIRVEMKMEGAEQWVLPHLDFYHKGEFVDLISSKFFNSTWMSLGNEEEWVYVDLGNSAEFDKVVLHWLKRPDSGKIQVSDDAKNWKDLASLPDGDYKDVIEVNGKGRYVRVLMNVSSDGKQYMLTEMEVWGRGGMVAQPKEAPEADDKEITLAGGNWKLLRANLTDADGPTIASGEYSSEKWLTATVPGTVLSSYVNLGAVPDPNYRDNAMHISDSYFNSDFWYRNEFTLSDDFIKAGKTWLEFDGINWKAEVYLNGKELGRIDGAFIRSRFDISDIAVEGKNYLSVRIIRNANPGAVKEKNENDTGRNGGILGYDNPTFHASIGWDWITTMRGRNIGIWNDVRIVKEGPVSIDAPYVNVKLPLPDTTSAVLTPEVIVRNNSSEPAQGTLKGKIGDIVLEKEVKLAAHEEKTIKFTAKEYPELNMENPKLWWPNGYGEQNLYSSEFSFVIGETLSDKVEFNVGIREVEAKLIDKVLHLYVNGRRFIGRGGNWGFSESNLNYRAREYDIAVEYHANANFNIMRNWVGQTGDVELYEACDRHGIMVWQDFWLANPADGPNPANEKMFLDNAKDLVKKIRRYPSMLIYCGRNEGYPPASIDKALAKIVKETHSDLHYIPSSADDCVSGHGPYNARSPKEYFAYPAGNDMFHSERGMPSVMTYESMVRTYSPEGLWPQGIEWSQHDYTLAGAQRCASFNEIISTGYGQATSAKEFAELAQFVNYDGYRAMFESRSIKRKGLLLWMSHPCWPSMTWQTYDWYFETNGAYFGSKKGSEPLHIQWNSATDTIEVVNYNALAQKNLTAQALLVNLDGSIAWEKTVTLDCEEDTTNKLFKMEFPQNSTDVRFIKLILSREDGKVLSDNFYINGKEYGNHQAMKNMAKATLKNTVSVEKGKDGVWTGKVILENKSTVPAVMIRLNVVGKQDGTQILPMFYEDNYFSLMPGEKKSVSLKWYDADTRGNEPRVIVTGYNL